MTNRQKERTRRLNDILRTSGMGGTVLITPGISGLTYQQQGEIIERVQTFDAFTPDNDPHGEHDFGSITHDGRTIFWKIDYYDETLEAGSDDPSDPDRTRRVLTIMLAKEY